MNGTASELNEVMRSTMTFPVTRAHRVSVACTGSIALRCTMNKRDTVLQMAHDGTPGSWTPAAFFLHFPSEYHRGRPAVEKHCEYFRETGNDVMKIQYELLYPPMPDLVRPAQWRDIECFGAEFYEPQLDVVAGVVNELKSEAVVVVTLYSAYMFASHLTGWKLLDRHMEEDPEAVSSGLEIITESMLAFIDACLSVGVDGFYASTQGGEAGRFSDPRLFDTYIRPHEMRVWDEIDSKGLVNILHVCDYEKPYDSLERFVDYPGQIVSAPLELTGGTVTAAEVARRFGRPFMGGMERLGPLSTGPVQLVKEEAAGALRGGPPAMILGADCTLSADAPWENIAAATGTAHRHNPNVGL